MDLTDNPSGIKRELGKTAPNFNRLCQTAYRVIALQFFKHIVTIICPQAYIQIMSLIIEINRK